MHKIILSEKANIKNKVDEKAAVTFHQRLHDTAISKYDWSKIDHTRYQVFSDYSGFKISAKRSERRQQIVKLCDYINKTGFLVNEKLFLKKEYLGIIPMWSNNKLIEIIEVESKDVNLVRAITRDIIIKDTLCYFQKIK